MGATPMMNRSAKDGARSSPHYGGEGISHSPIVPRCLLTARYGEFTRDPRRPAWVPAPARRERQAPALAIRGRAFLPRPTYVLFEQISRGRPTEGLPRREAHLLPGRGRARYVEAQSRHRRRHQSKTCHAVEPAGEAADAVLDPVDDEGGSSRRGCPRRNGCRSSASSTVESPRRSAVTPESNTRGNASCMP